MGTKLSSFLQCRINIFISQRLGWRIAYRYITILGAVYFFFRRKEKWKIKEAVESAFAARKSNAEINSITQVVFRGTLLHYYEKLFNAFSSAETLKDFFKIHMESEGITAIERGLAGGRGVLLITGHLGGVEFIPGYLASNHYPVTILARFSSNHLRERSIQKADRFDAKIIDVDNTPNITKAILHSLRENRIVITLCDEMDEWRPYRYHMNCFLGKQIYLDRTLNILTKRARASLVFGIMHRDNNHQYKFIATSWEVMAKRIRRSADMSMGAVVLKFLEQYIYEYPEQWYQWKKYADMGMVPSHKNKYERLASPQVLNPSLEKVS